MNEVLLDSQVPVRAILVAVSNQKQNKVKTLEYLAELEFLASTIDIETVATFVQALEMPDKRTFIGKGKVEEIRASAIQNEANAIIFDDDLSPSQVRNIENELQIRIYDRSLLILDIFLFRAKTAQAKTQVELARSQYLLPRLTHMWSHLERQRGGTGAMGGAGEKEIETDKRDIRDKISRLKNRLKDIDVQNETQRKGRDKQVRVSLVGYTNVGKSTLMRVLTKADVFAENKLFATVDSTVRKTAVNEIPYLLTDTVGFIRKLPHTLVECFKSTLDEVRESDVLMHIVDVSHPSFEEHIDVVKKTLIEIKAADKPTLVVYNKVDAYLETHPEETWESLKTSYLSDENVVFIAAAEKTNIEELKEKIFGLVKKRYLEIFPNYIHYFDYTQEFEE